MSDPSGQLEQDYEDHLAERLQYAREDATGFATALRGSDPAYLEAALNGEGLSTDLSTWSDPERMTVAIEAHARALAEQRGFDMGTIDGQTQAYEAVSAAYNSAATEIAIMAMQDEAAPDGPALAHIGEWVVEDESREYRDAVVATDAGFHPGYETSYMGGEGELSYSAVAFPTVDEAGAVAHSYYHHRRHAQGDESFRLELAKEGLLPDAEADQAAAISAAIARQQPHTVEDNERRRAVEADVMSAVDMAQELLGPAKSRSMYLDPVTSFAVTHDGAGFQREVTIFLPYGEFERASTDSAIGRMAASDAARRLVRDGSDWSFSGNNAEADGHFSAYVDNDPERDILMVHIRELERGMGLPEIEYMEISRGQISPVSVPVLTGTGMVQHSSRNLSAMAFDTDYMAASYLAIARGEAAERCPPIQAQDAANFRHAEVLSEAGGAAFRREGTSQRQDLVNVLAASYGQDASGSEQIFAAVADYYDKAVAPKELIEEKRMDVAPIGISYPGR